MNHKRRLQAELERVAALLSQLTKDFNSVVEAAQEVSTDDEHDPDGATIGYERAKADAMITMSKAHLAELHAAIERVNNGTYNTCKGCGRPVGESRLEAHPCATLCIGCASTPPRRLQR